LSTDNKIINGLWIGKTLSSVELLCLHSFLAHGHEFHLWAYDAIETSLPAGVVLEDAARIIPREKIFCYKHFNQFGHGKGSYAGFSDIFRYKLLYELGGWWADMDVVCLKPFDFDQPYVLRTHHDFPVVGNIMKCPAGSELMMRCHETSVEQITEENTDWNLPIRILNRNIAELDLQEYILDITNPDNWNFVKKLICRNKDLPEQWYALHLVNEEWRRNEIDKNAVPRYSCLGKKIREYNIGIKSGIFSELRNHFRIIFPKHVFMNIYWFFARIFWRSVRLVIKERKTTNK
jgi:hypothetical protein